MSDLISRQAAIDALRVVYWDDNIQSAKDDPCIVDAMTDWAIRQIKALPSARPKGKWIFNPRDGIEAMFTKPKCSVCGFESADGLNFCPNCGAKMNEVEERKWED